MNQVRSEFGLNKFVDQFCEINRAYLLNHTSKLAKILQGNTKQMELYFGKCSRQMKFENILLDKSCQIY